MTLTGSGLSKSTLTVEIGDQPCPVIYSNVSSIICKIPAAVSIASRILSCYHYKMLCVHEYKLL